MVDGPDMGIEICLFGEFLIASYVRTADVLPLREIRTRVLVFNVLLELMLTGVFIITELAIGVRAFDMGLQLRFGTEANFHRSSILIGLPWNCAFFTEIFECAVDLILVPFQLAGSIKPRIARLICDRINK